MQGQVSPLHYNLSVDSKQARAKRLLAAQHSPTNKGLSNLRPPELCLLFSKHSSYKTCTHVHHPQTAKMFDPIPAAYYEARIAESASKPDSQSSANQPAATRPSQPRTRTSLLPPPTTRPGMQRAITSPSLGANANALPRPPLPSPTSSRPTSTGMTLGGLFQGFVRTQGQTQGSSAGSSKASTPMERTQAEMKRDADIVSTLRYGPV